jgi:hypothetical protein
MGQRGDIIKLTQTSHGKRGDFWQNYGDGLTNETIKNLELVRDWVA